MMAFCRVLPMLLARPSLAASFGAGLITAGLLVTAPAVQAADMPIPGRAYYPPVPPAIYDWTGIYVGGHIGGGILVDSFSQNGVSPGGFNLAGTGDLTPSGVIGGGQIGANYEFAPWVVGIEGSFTDSGISGSTLVGCSGPCLFSGTAVSQVRFTSNPQWFAALTGRVGYAANDSLFYAKAGGSWMRDAYTEPAI
jgi:outer membrane immunogenic protein